MSQSCGEVTQPPVARLPKLWLNYSGPSVCGEVTKSVARLPVARLPCGKVTRIRYEKSNDGNPSEKVIKESFKTNTFLNSTMMPSFLLNSERKITNKQRKMCLLLQCITNSHISWKNTK